MSVSCRVVSPRVVSCRAHVRRLVFVRLDEREVTFANVEADAPWLLGPPPSHVATLERRLVYLMGRSKLRGALSPSSPDHESCLP